MHKDQTGLKQSTVWLCVDYTFINSNKSDYLNVYFAYFIHSPGMGMQESNSI